MLASYTAETELARQFLADIARFIWPYLGAQWNLVSSFLGGHEEGISGKILARRRALFLPLLAVVRNGCGMRTEQRIHERTHVLDGRYQLDGVHGHSGSTMVAGSRTSRLATNRKVIHPLHFTAFKECRICHEANLEVQRVARLVAVIGLEDVDLSALLLLVFAHYGKNWWQTQCIL